MGDEFIPRGVEVDAVIPNASSAPPWLGRFARDFCGLDVVRAGYSGSTPFGGAGEVFIDVLSLFSGRTKLPASVSARLSAVIRRVVPLGVSRLVHLPDPASEAVAQHLSAQIERFGGRKVRVAPLGQAQQEAQTLAGTGATLAVAGVVAGGRSLLAASQILRDLQPDGALSLFVFLARSPTEDRWRELKSNVTYGEGPGDYPLGTVISINLPNVRERGIDSWGDEHTFLLKLLRVRSPKRVLAWLRWRIERLDSFRSDLVRGGVNDLFLASATSVPLKLRPGFAWAQPPKVGSAA